MPDRVLQAMHVPSPNIYEGEVVEITDQVLVDLCALAKTTTASALIYIGNGHAAWEAALVNTMGEGDRALVISTGTFATAWGVIAESVGVVVETLEFGMRRAANPAAITEYLSRPESKGIKAVMVCQTDTASSCNNDIAAIRGAIDAARHPALYMVDCVASFACEEMRMDEWGVDCIIAGSQKGLMVPAGLGFNFVSPKAKAARQAMLGRVSAYWDWLPRIDPEFFYYRFAGTLPTHHLYGLRTALEMIVREGNRSAIKLSIESWHASCLLGETVECETDVFENTYSRGSRACVLFLLPASSYRGHRECLGAAPNARSSCSCCNRPLELRRRRLAGEY